MNPWPLPRRTADELVKGRHEPDAATLERAREIVDSVRTGGEPALRRWAVELDGLAGDDPLVLGRDRLAEAWRGIDAKTRNLLARTAERIATFARHQRRCLADLEVPLPGGAAGHTAVPLERAGCYAPGGRAPLPSSVLMTAVTAREAGVASIWVASPRPRPTVLAAAWLAGAEAVVAAGGAQAIAALAFGAGPVPACDAVVGPGNRWVEAAKRLVAASVRTGPPAGPSELAIVADASADPRHVAAELLAQAEHDPDARVWLIALDEATLGAVQAALVQRLGAAATAPATRLARHGDPTPPRGRVAPPRGTQSTADPQEATIHRGRRGVSLVPGGSGTPPSATHATEGSIGEHEHPALPAPPATVVRTVLAASGAVVVADREEAAALCDRLAPEHLQLAVRDPAELAARVRHAGTVFLGPHTSVVLGDYGAGPNHVLPTGGAARAFAGLSVLDFLRLRTWLRIDDPAAAAPLFSDAASLAEVEGLPAHAGAARVSGPTADEPPLRRYG